MKARFQNLLTKQTKPRRKMAFWVALLMLAFLCGLAACAPQSSQDDPTSVVERYLTAKRSNDYEAWKATLWAARQDSQAFTPSFEKPGDLGVLSLSVEKVAASDEETARIRKMYAGSDLAKSHGWSDDYIAKNLVAVTAQYTVDYDNTKVPYPEGALTQYFYLVRDDANSPWLIWDSGF
jgi:hypothetical protein